MYFFFPRKLIESGRRSCKMILIIFWCIGFAGGTVAAAGAGNLTSLMRACCDSSVSIVGLFLVPFFPFLISAVAVYFSLPWLLCLTALCKMFSFGFCTCAVAVGFAEAGWLICLLLLFTDLCTLPVLCWFQFRHSAGGRRILWKDVLCPIVWFLAVCAVDRIWIVPLLIDIF